LFIQRITFEYTNARRLQYHPEMDAALSKLYIGEKKTSLAATNRFNFLQLIFAQVPIPLTYLSFCAIVNLIHWRDHICFLISTETESAISNKIVCFNCGTFIFLGTVKIHQINILICSHNILPYHEVFHGTFQCFDRSFSIRW
jgi:hypothetical protein